MNLKIGAIIKTLRQNKKITQEQLAAFIGVTPQAISRWEAGNGYPDIVTGGYFAGELVWLENPGREAMELVNPVFTEATPLPASEKVRVTSVFRPGRMGVRISLRLTSTVGTGAESDSFSEGSGSAAEGAAGLAGEASGSAA